MQMKGIIVVAQARSQGVAWGGNATPGAREYQLFATRRIVLQFC